MIRPRSLNWLMSLSLLTLCLAIRPSSLASALTWIRNRKARSSSSSVRIRTSSHGNLLTCQVYRENSLSTLSMLIPSINRSSSFSIGSMKRKAIGEEVARLLAAGFIREIYHSEWLVNVVMVPKKDKSLRMCIDFKHINRAFPTFSSPSHRSNC